MRPLDQMPAIRRIETDRNDLCAVEVVSRFTAADLENAYGLLEAAYTEHEKIDVLVRITNYEGFDWSAAFNDATIGGKTRALRHIRRYALIGAPGWMRVVIGVFGPLTSIESRFFDAADEPAAWAWLSARPIEPA